MMDVAEFVEQAIRTIKRRRISPSVQNTKARLDRLSATLRAKGWRPKLTSESYESIIINARFRAKTLPLAAVATELLLDGQPMTLRGLFYRVVSAGWLPSTDRKHYDALGRVMTMLREAGVVPFPWLVDNVRATIKPSSWSGLADFSETVRDAYRKDFWATLPEYVHVFCEKDAMAGVLAPITREYDVPLSVVRGYVSLSFAHDVAELWNEIEKPIAAYYLGDFDPSGLNLEDDLRDKLTRYCHRSFSWRRLAVNPDDFDTFDLFPLQPKAKDRRTAAFIRAGYTQCAELDAIPADALRRRLEDAILAHIPGDEWARLQRLEALEQETWARVMASAFGNGHGGEHQTEGTA